MDSQPKRKSTRLKGFDYSKCGAYFVTICTHNRAEILSRIELSIDPNDSLSPEDQQFCRGDPCGRPTINLTPLGTIALETLNTIESSFDVKVERYTIMPDHIHLILLLNAERETARVSPTGDAEAPGISLGAIVGAYKSLVLNAWRHICNENGIRMGKVWQRGYYDHIIRSREELCEIRKYMKDNPAKRYYETTKPV